uniref:phosphopantetheine-binding protein n=1 Tax=Algoriphagus sp. TaxID=1872435 RepID=UPI0040472604
MKIEIDIFLINLEKILEIDYSLALESKLSEISSVDSLTYMVISAWIYDQTNVQISVNEIENCITIRDLYNLLK